MTTLGVVNLKADVGWNEANFTSSVLWDWRPEIWNLWVVHSRWIICSQKCQLSTLLFKFILSLYIFFNISVNLFAGNPLTQDILNLYQEPDGTRRLLNYLLDNLAGTAKRSKCSFLKHFFLLYTINVIITCCISTLNCSHSFNWTATSKILDHVARTRPYKTDRYCNA